MESIQTLFRKCIELENKPIAGAADQAIIASLSWWKELQESVKKLTAAYETFTKAQVRAINTIIAYWHNIALQAAASKTAPAKPGSKAPTPAT